MQHNFGKTLEEEMSDWEDIPEGRADCSGRKDSRRVSRCREIFGCVSRISQSHSLQYHRMIDWEVVIAPVVHYR